MFEQAIPSLSPSPDLQSRAATPLSKYDVNDTPRSPTDGGFLGGTSIKIPIVRLDNVFNFQIVVFQYYIYKVENMLFQVLRNGFNVPGTPFEAMFALPNAAMGVDDVSLEGSSLENPIHLPGIKADHFRTFLRILYPFIDQTPIVEFDEWVGVLNLATMWSFQRIREKAITRLSDLIKQKTLLERISLAREYRVPQWLRDGYLELSQKRPLEFDELRPAKPYHLGLNWEADAKKWEANATTWEMLARIYYIQTKVATSISNNGNTYCSPCGIYNGPSYPGNPPCKCHILPVVDEVFREELGSMEENPNYVEDEEPLPSLNRAGLPIDPKGSKKKKSKK
ncbi:hypothetical protein BYT27DRAFT_7216720 [Phlegmacium glaucopus]|nr:hypothetical protein BYT27DRAFT_7216720 [Phlegmacium glaucopus]